MVGNNKRRRIFYIDKVFQKKLLLLFLGINGIIVIANIVFYLTYLKGKLEGNMFRSHISISNLNEILAGDVIYFNILLAVISLFLVLIFYTLVRLRLDSFCKKIKQAIFSRQEQAEDAQKEQEPLQIPEAFYEIDRVMGQFFQYTDRKLEDEEKRIASLKELIKRAASPAH